MKKMLLCLGGCFFAALCGGCMQSENSEINSSDIRSETVEEEKINIDLQDTYYKLRLESMEIDVDTLTEYLLGKNAAYIEMAQRNEAEEMEETGEIRFELMRNDDSYVWTYNTPKTVYFFLHGESPFAGKPETEDGKNAADEFVSLLGIDFSQNIEIDLEQQEPGSTVYTYKQQYKGADFAGNIPIGIGNGERIDGSWIDVFVDTEGIKMVSINNLNQVVEEIEAYSTEDFYPIEEVIKMAEMYGKNYLMQDVETETDINGGVTEISVIYIPFEEDDVVYWKPGYQVICEYTVSGKTERYRAVMDVFDGYIYDWRGL